MVDISKAYDRINTSLLCDKMRETELPGQVIALIDFMCKNTFVCTSYGGQLSDEWNVRNGVTLEESMRCGKSLLIEWVELFCLGLDM